MLFELNSLNSLRTGGKCRFPDSFVTGEDGIHLHIYQTRSVVADETKEKIMACVETRVDHCYFCYRNVQTVADVRIIYHSLARVREIKSK